MSNKTLIIAEAGVNHNGEISKALELVNVAKEAGADIVKFQTFKANEIASQVAKLANYQKKNTQSSNSQVEMLKKLELTPEAHLKIFEHCKELNIEFLSTAFDIDSLNFLVKEFNISRIKIASGELTNAPFLYHAAKYKIPMILSTGMATMEEINQALQLIFYSKYNDDYPSSSKQMQGTLATQINDKLYPEVTLLHCTTEYPTPLDQANLKAISAMTKQTGLKVGYSDHTLGILAPIIAVSLGATVVEKHFTIDKNLDGPDHKASLEPEELKAMIRAIRETEQALGTEEKKVQECEKPNINIARKSLFFAQDVNKGTLLEMKHFKAQRPGNGVSPTHIWDLLGKPAQQSYRAGEKLEIQ